MKTLHVSVISVLALCSCNSNHLSRQMAAELISKQQNLPATQTIVFGRYIRRAWGVPSFMPAACVVSERPGDQYSDVQQRLAQWQSMGLIRIGEAQERKGECNYLWTTTSLTDEGKKYLVKEYGFSHEVKAYDLAFGEITGIQINEQFKAAEADYTLKVINVTPFGNSISAEPIPRRATFALFDDGWRIK